MTPQPRYFHHWLPFPLSKPKSFRIRICYVMVFQLFSFRIGRRVVKAASLTFFNTLQLHCAMISGRNINCIYT